jgi:hypothetical protein
VRPLAGHPSVFRQAQLIRRWQPWQNSTGPKTTAGKAICAQNASRAYGPSSVRAIPRRLYSRKLAIMSA